MKWLARRSACPGLCSETPLAWYSFSLMRAWCVRQRLNIPGCRFGTRPWRGEVRWRLLKTPPMKSFSCFRAFAVPRRVSVCKKRVAGRSDDYGWRGEGSKGTCVHLSRDRKWNKDAKCETQMGKAVGWNRRRGSGGSTIKTAAPFSNVHPLNWPPHTKRFAHRLHGFISATSVGRHP